MAQAHLDNIKAKLELKLVKSRNSLLEFKLKTKPIDLNLSQQITYSYLKSKNYIFKGLYIRFITFTDLLIFY